MADKIKLHLAGSSNPVTLSHGHISGVYEPGKTYDCTPEEWEQVFKPIGLFEIGAPKKIKEDK